MSFSRHGDLVEEVFAFAGAVDAPPDRHLRVLGREDPLRVLDDEGRFGHAQRLARLRPVEDHVFHLVARAARCIAARRAPSGSRRRCSSSRSRSARRWRRCPLSKVTFTLLANDLKPMISSFERYMRPGGPRLLRMDHRGIEERHVHRHRLRVVVVRVRKSADREQRTGGPRSTPSQGGRP